MALRSVLQDPSDNYSHNGSGNGLELSGKKLSPEPILTKFYNVI